MPRILRSVVVVVLLISATPALAQSVFDPGASRGKSWVTYWIGDLIVGARKARAANLEQVLTEATQKGWKYEGYLPQTQVISGTPIKGYLLLFERRGKRQ